MTQYCAGTCRIDDYSFAFALLNTAERAASTCRIQLEGGLREDDLKDTPGDFRPVIELCERGGCNPIEVTLCADFEEVAQPRWSPFSKFTILLSKSGFGAFGMATSEKDDRFFVHRIPDEAKAQVSVGKEVCLISKHMGRAWHEFVCDKPGTPEDEAIALAQIASRKHLYYYLSSHGVVQSPNDLLHFLAHTRKDQKYFVISDTEMYLLIPGEADCVGKPSDVSLEYQLAVKRFSFLSENQARKFALLRFCKLFGVKLYCLTFRDNSESIRASGMIVDPVPLAEDYLVWPNPD